MMTSDTQPNKIGYASLCFGLTAISLWILIFLKQITGPSLIVFFPAAIIVSVIGFILGIIGTAKKYVKKKYAIIGIIINAPVLLILLILALPFFVESTYVPDTKEINDRFNEFLVNPSEIQGIKALKGDGYALFKYYTSNEDFFKQLKQQVSAKGWTMQSSKDFTIEFIRENHMKSEGEIYLFRYEHVKTFHNKESGLVCVGFNKIVEADEVPNFNKLKDTVDAKATELTLWDEFNCCITGEV